MKISKWLCTNKNVTKVNYVGCLTMKAIRISKSQASGFGAMISFNVKEVEIVERVLRKVRLIYVC